VPEGHTIHRYARLHREALAGRQVRASSPQGRFAEGAARLDGATLVDVQAHGKHLFYRFEPTGTLHVHLGLFGRFRQFGDTDAPPPTDGTRLALRDGRTTLYLAGAVAVELIDADEERRLRSRLGPDPLDPAADPARFHAALSRRTAGVGQALLDQKAIAGIGNVFRAEVLFLAGLHPDLPAKEVPPAKADEIWQRLVALLTAGERSGRIVTVTAADRDRPPSRLTRDQRVYVYKRAGRPCHRCRDAVASWELGGRTIFACPTDQPR
jgi:endonuclease VIII